MLAIESIQTSIDKMEKSLKEHMGKNFHSSGRILTGRKTAHDFDESQLTYLQALRSELNNIRARLTDLEKTCNSAFKHDFSAMKRKSRSRKQNSSKNKKRKKKRNVARTTELLKKIAPGFKEGKACTKDDLSAGIIKELGKRERKWATALTSSSCNLLEDSAKYMVVCNILGAGGDDSDDSGSWDEADQDDSGRDDNASDHCENDDGRTDDINRSDVAGSDVGSVGREGGHACGSLIGLEKEISYDDSNSSYDVGPYWETSGCIPYCQPISDSD